MRSVNLEVFSAPNLDLPARYRIFPSRLIARIRLALGVLPLVLGDRQRMHVDACRDDGFVGDVGNPDESGTSVRPPRLFGLSVKRPIASRRELALAFGGASTTILVSARPLQSP
jgi:hypothetical protein